MILDFKTYVAEGLWNDVVRRGITGEDKREISHKFTRWGRTAQIKCDDDTFNAVINEILFWRRNFDMEEGPEGHWFIQKNYSPSSFVNGLGGNIDLLHSENPENCIVFDSFANFKEVEEGWYETAYVEFDIDNEDYNKAVELILDKIDDMQFIHSGYFDNDDNVDSADGYGIVLCELNNTPAYETRLKVLNKFKALITPKSKFNDWEMKMYMCIWNEEGDDTYLIMRPCEYLFDNFDEVCELARKAAKQYGC